MSLEKMRKLLIAKDTELATQAIKPRADTSIYPLRPTGSNDQSFLKTASTLIRQTLLAIENNHDKGNKCQK
jgi:hypothetical protein